MEELIPINEHNGKKAVDARLLHQYLESKREFTTWIKDRIKKYGFIENQDYVVFDEIVKNPNGGRPLTEYVLTLSCAKELAMVEGSKKGQEARRYFIACEEKLQELANPKSQLDILVESAIALREQEKRLSTVEGKVDSIIQRQEEAEKELKALPIASEVVPELPLRDKIRLLVNRYCSATGLLQKQVWDNIYQTMYYNYHIAVKAYKKAKNESWIDIAEKRGFLDKMYIVASNLLRDKGLAT